MSPNGQLTLISNTPTHTTYDLDNEIDKPSEITFNQNPYVFKEVHKDSDKVSGEYKEGTTHITYVYKLSKQNPVRKSKQKVLSKTGLNAQASSALFGFLGLASILILQKRKNNK